MTLAPDDRAAISDLLARHGHLFDDGELDRLDLLFTASVSYDITAFGGGVLHGIEAIRAATLALGDRNPIGHHVTNVVLTEKPDGSVRARSKGLGVYADGTAGSVTYEDTIVRTGEGWRIDARTVVPRRAPLGGAGGQQSPPRSWERVRVRRARRGPYPGRDDPAWYLSYR